MRSIELLRLKNGANQSADEMATDRPQSLIQFSATAFRNVINNELGTLFPKNVTIPITGGAAVT